MSDINYYIKYIGQNNSDKNLIITEMADNYNNNYNNAITKFEVMINTDRANLGYINLDKTNQIRLLLDMEDKISKASFKPSLWRTLWIQSNKIKTGDYITITNKERKNEETYIIIEMFEHRDGYDLCYMQSCNNSLKFIVPSDKTIQSIPCIMSNMSLYSIGMDEGNIITTLDGKRFITIAYNQYTKELKNGMRFILNGDAFMITEIYKGNVINENGTLEIKMQSCAISSNDDLVNGVADALNLHKYEVNILNGQSVSLNYQNSTLQLNVEVTDNGGKINNPTLTYISDNTYTAIVDNNGLITCKGTGIANITVSYQGVNKTIQVNGVMINTNNNKVIINGTSYIKIGQTSTYTCQFSDYNNNPINKNAIWSVYAEDGITSTTLASITSQDSTSCKIKANSNNNLGYILLKCSSEDNQITNTYKIQIKPLI